MTLKALPERALTPSLRGARLVVSELPGHVVLSQEEPRRDRRQGSLQKLAAAPDGEPVGCVRATAPGYHYT